MLLSKMAFSIVHSLNNLSFLRRSVQASVTALSKRMISTPSPAIVSDSEISPKIESLVQEITKLTLLEVSELNNALKKTLNLPDISPAAFGSVPAAAPIQEEEVQPVVKSNYTLKLIKYDDAKKIALIKEIKSLLEDMNLVQAKKFIESAPVVVKADIGKDEAERLKEALTKCGAECTID